LGALSNAGPRSHLAAQNGVLCSEQSPALDYRSGALGTAARRTATLQALNCGTKKGERMNCLLTRPCLVQLLAQT
jgi:hypothetical protein